MADRNFYVIPFEENRQYGFIVYWQNVKQVDQRKKTPLKLHDKAQWRKDR